jgi:hypothetical protein
VLSSSCLRCTDAIPQLHSFCNTWHSWCRDRKIQHWWLPAHFVPVVLLAVLAVTTGAWSGRRQHTKKAHDVLEPTLYPLYSFVLCEAVTMMPAAQPSSATPAATKGVGTKSWGRATWGQGGQGGRVTQLLHWCVWMKGGQGTWGWAQSPGAGKPGGQGSRGSGGGGDTVVTLTCVYRMRICTG